MKRTFAQKGLISLVAGFFLFGLMLLTASRAQAQTLNWKPSGEAQQVLENEGLNYRNQLQVLNPGTQQHTSALAHFYYYKRIHRNIADGTSVEASVKKALEIFKGSVQGASNAPSAETVVDLTVNKALLEELYTDAVGILTN